MVKKYKIFVYNYFDESDICLASIRAMKIKEKISCGALFHTQENALILSTHKKRANTATHRFFHLIPIARKIIINPTSVGGG